MQSYRKLLQQEIRLLTILIEKASITLPEDWQEKMIVCSMDDGHMGSLRLYPNGEVLNICLFEKQISECRFFDKDGVLVLASLNLDREGNMFELDIWKTDYTPLINIPEQID